ncbi:metal-dependent hydrolase [Glaciecola siphonariae]|uniref:Metal-dependent hydrolase n=1 Tax=Glaciecola siphonariae TaxID=521012 RepID=A0ABV9LYP1_9ALTE
MDSLTQVALGGAVAYTVMGRKMGAKAALWGAALGTLPDLDVFIPYGDAISDFTYHRSFSHSLLVHVLVTPLIAWLMTKCHASARPYFKQCMLLVFLCLSTHAILDSFTVYGTQLFWPLTEYPFGIANLFIIDLLVTIPLLMGFIAALLPRLPYRKAKRLNLIGLGLCTLYITWSLVAQQYINHKIERTLANNNIVAGAYMSTPAPFTTLLWRAVVMSDEGYYEVYASVFDTPEQVSVTQFTSQEGLLDGLEDNWHVQRLRWFTKGLYSVSEQQSAIVMSDLRMGTQCNYVFNFKVAERSINGPKAVDVEQYSSRPDMSGLKKLFERIWQPSIVLSPPANTPCGELN